MAYENVPGFIWTIRGGGIVPTSTLPTTERVTIIGSALDGPVNTPTRVGKLSEAEALFGPLVFDNAYASGLNTCAATGNRGRYSGNTLIQGMYEAYQGGAGDIILIRVGGESATGTIGTFPGTGILFTARWPGRIYNGIQISAVSGSGGYIRIDFPEGKRVGGFTYRTYEYSKYTTVGALVEAINGDGYNRAVRATCAVSVAASGTDALEALTVATKYLSGGVDGTTEGNAPDLVSTTATRVDRNEALYSALAHSTSGLFEVVDDLETDLIVLNCLRVDDSVGTATAGFSQEPSDAEAEKRSVLYAFGRFCHNLSRNTYPTHGVIGLRKLSSMFPRQEDINQHVDNLAGTNGFGWYVLPDSRGGTGEAQTLAWTQACYFLRPGYLDFNDEDEGTIDLGRYLSVVAGPDVQFVNGKRGAYWENAAALYAGMISRTPAQQALTNRELPGILGLTYTLTKSQLNRLAGGQPYDDSTYLQKGGAYVVFRSTLTDGIVVCQDVTAGQRAHDYENLQTYRIVARACHGVRSALKKFIGAPHSVETRMAMETAVKGVLDAMAEEGALLASEGLGYQFAITSDPYETIIGKVNVELRLRPAWQIKFVKVTVGVTH